MRSGLEEEEKIVNSSPRAKILSDTFTGEIGVGAWVIPIARFDTAINGVRVIQAISFGEGVEYIYELMFELICSCDTQN